jgi:hypothetical protein
MAELEGILARRLALVDAVDHLLNKGVVLTGEATISLAGVDLIYLGLNLVLSSVATLEETEGRLPLRQGGRSVGSLVAPIRLRPVEGASYSGETRVGDTVPDAGGFGTHYASPAASTAPLLDEGDRPERGLARLVLTVIELLRRVLERQALRRIDGPGLSDDEVERMGRALMALEAKMAELRDVFGLSDDDLNIDLGPLGELL